MSDLLLFGEDPWGCPPGIEDRCPVVCQVCGFCWDGNAQHQCLSPSPSFIPPPPLDDDEEDGYESGELVIDPHPPVIQEPEEPFEEPFHVQISNNPFRRVRKLLAPKALRGGLSLKYKRQQLQRVVKGGRLAGRLYRGKRMGAKAKRLLKRGVDHAVSNLHLEPGTLSRGLLKVLTHEVAAHLVEQLLEIAFAL
jgi:hypothetical protein